METAMIFPQLSGTDILMPKKQGSDKAINSENSEFGFLDDFLSILITNMNPNEMNLDSNTSQKLSQYINKEIEQNQSLNGLDMDAFLTNLKAELSNSKPHKLSLDGLKSTIKNLLRLNNKASKFQKIQLNDSKENIAQLVEQMKSVSNEKGVDNKIDHFLQNIRKYLTKEEFEVVRKNLLTQSKSEITQTSTKVNAISKFISTIEGKEEVAKSKIIAKSENIELKTDKKQPQILNSKVVSSKAIESNINSESNTIIGTKNDVRSEVNSTLLTKNNESPSNQEIEKDIQKLSTQKVSVETSEISSTLKGNEKAAIQTAPKEIANHKESQIKFDENYSSLEKQLKQEQSTNNNSDKESNFLKDFGKQQSKEQVKQNIAKSDIAELLSKSNTAKKTEAKRTEQIVKSNFVERTINSIKMTKSGGSNIARIMLQPRSLGNLTMRISLIGDRVKLYIKADKSEAAEHIDRQLPLLKERMAENGLKVEQIVIESSESEHLANNQQEGNRNEQEELRRQFVKSFGNAAKGNFDVSLSDVEYFNSSPYEGYTKAGRKLNV